MFIISIMITNNNDDNNNNNDIDNDTDNIEPVLV